MRPHDLPSAAALAKDKPHGTRLRYMAGCKCMLCRAANSRYETERAAARKNGDWNGLVSAIHARRHILKLSCDVMNDARLIPPRATRQIVERLLEEGMTKTELARRLGSTAEFPALQILQRNRVTAKTAMRVERLWRQMTEGEREARKRGEAPIPTEKHRRTHCRMCGEIVVLLDGERLMWHRDYRAWPPKMCRGSELAV